MTKRLVRTLFGASLAATGVMLSLVVATGPTEAQDSACNPHDIDLGGGFSVKGGCKPLKVAFLSAASNNLYVQAGIKGAQDAGAKYGVSIDVFDANWDPAKQFNQAQNVITGGQYDAILAEMLDGKQACNIISKDAREAGVLVAVINGPLCGRTSEEGEVLWTPGTLNFIGGSQGREAFRAWLLGVAEENPGPQKVAVITGPDLNSNTINTDLAIEEVRKRHPDFNIVGVVRTDYSVLQGNQKFGPLLQANPNLTILASNYSDMTRGALSAIQQAGMSGKIRVYDYGGNAWSFEALKNDMIVSTRTITPYTETFLGLEALVKAWNGEPVERYTPLETAEITKANMADHKPEF